LTNVTIYYTGPTKHHSREVVGDWVLSAISKVMEFAIRINMVHSRPQSFVIMQ